MKNNTIRLALVIATLTVPFAAHAQNFMTSFETPTYLAGQSALGVYGWQACYASYGYLGGTTQTVTNARASDGSQSLFFNDAADANSNALRETQILSTTGTTTFSTDVWIGGGSGAGRIAELRFSQAAIGGSNTDSVISIGGDGTVRAGYANYAYSSANSNIGYTRFANAGTYADRWLRLSLNYVASSGLTTASLSGLGDGQSFSYAFTNFTGGGQILLASTVNVSASNQTGQVWFDNVGGPAAVPEPTTLAAFGIGAVGIAIRRRRR